MSTEKQPDAASSVLQTRLRSAVDATGSIKEFAAKSGIPKDTLNKYLSGSQPGPSALIRMADAAEVSVDYLLGRATSGNVSVPPRKLKVSVDDITFLAHRVEYEEGEFAVPEGFVAVPYLEVRASAGRGRASLPAETVAASHFLFSEAWLRSLGVSAQNAELLQAQGDSMHPTIQDGDLMLVDRGYDEVVHGKIYALVVNELVVVKRVNILAIGGMMLISDNDRYPSETVRREDIGNLSFQGRVAWYGRAI